MCVCVCVCVWGGGGVGGNGEGCGSGGEVWLGQGCVMYICVYNSVIMQCRTKR